jgi:hypothetical protein
MELNLSQIQLERLIRTANVCANPKWEGDISGLAFAMLRYSGLDIENGYIITSENHINNIDRRKMDIVVEILLGRQKVLVIECKMDTSHPTRSKQQIQGYMQDGGFPHGMIMYPLSTTLFSLEIDNDEEVIVGPTYNNITEVEDIIKEMMNMRMLELEN